LFQDQAGSDIRERIRFIGLDRHARHALKTLQPLIVREIGLALDAFYARAAEFEFTRDFFKNTATLAHAKTHQAAHWTILSDAEFDERYEQAVRRVGQTHARLGLPPRWYIGGYALVAEHLMRSLVEEGGASEPLADGLTSLMKAVFVDMDLAISTYLESLEAQRRAEEQARRAVEQQQTLVLRALADALARVAEGDLTAMVEQEVAPEHEQLRHDFNGALRRLIEARREVEDASQAKSVFLANMSHEIRTPLNGVMGVAGALARTPLSSEQQEMVSLIETSAKTLETLLSDILDLARIEAGKMDLRPEPFDLAASVDACAALFDAAAQAKGLGLRVAIEPDARGAYVGDAPRLRQILSNLLGNAVKFTEAGGVTLTVDARRGASSSELRFEVRDTGIGFDAETKARLFARFEQADGAITRKFGGSGLGLSISRSLAEAMGGRLEGDGLPGEGAVFALTLELPRCRGAGDRRRDTSWPTPEVGPLAGKRVLLAEDHPTNRRVVELILSAAGVDLSCVENGAEAVEAFRGGVFDLILMDMQMPVMDGLTAIGEIRRIEAAAGVRPTPIHVLTANAMPEHVSASLAAGADGHLPKPIQAEALLTRVAEVACEREGPRSAIGKTA
jgi:signal transduction histidine kinase/ActR/RegA family two-component response regulator